MHDTAFDIASLHRAFASGLPPERLIDARRPADDRALRPDHGEGRRLELGEIALGRILGEQALIAAVIGFAHAGLDADLGGDTCEDELAGAEALQLLREAGGVEGPLARLLDDDLVRKRRDLTDDGGARLAGDQHPPHRAAIADADRRIAALALRRMQVGKIGPVAFHRVDHRQFRCPEAVDEPPHRGDDGLQAKDIVAEARAEASGLGEIALHVDDDERDGPRIEPEGEGECRDLAHQRCPAK